MINNILHSLFQQVQISLNNAPVENTNRNYAYRAYLENLLCYNKESKETLISNCGWITVTEGIFIDKQRIAYKSPEYVGVPTYKSSSVTTLAVEGISKCARWNRSICRLTSL